MKHEQWRGVSFFARDEFDSPEEMSLELVTLLDAIRRDVDAPMIVTSSYRPGDARAHGKGLAVDVSDNAQGDDVSAHWRYRVLKAALEHGIRRCGVYDRHVHLDVWADGPQDVIWWAKSR